MTAQPTVPAGWYQAQGDPPGTQRWWDGRQWTSAQQAVAQPVAPQLSVVESQTVAVAEPAVPHAEPQSTVQPQAADVHEPAAEMGSMLANDLASYWDSLEEKSDPAKEFASTWDDDESGDASAGSSDGAALEGSNSPSPVAWAVLPYRKFATFSGRSCRAEFWWFTLLNSVVMFGLFVALAATAGDLEAQTELSSISMAIFFAMLGFGLITTIPSWAVAVRRLHDTGRSGWAVLIGCIPVIGNLWILAIYCTPGSRTSNNYGNTHITP